VRRGVRYWFECVVALWAATFFLTGCAGHGPARYRGVVVQSAPAATQLFSSLISVNRSLVTFKGLGTVTLVQKGQLQKFRGAWAAAGPDKFRLQLFGPAGQPVFSMACDGRHYYLLSSEKEGVVKQRVAAAGLKKYIEIPIGVPELFSVFCGRPPSDGTKPPVALLEKDALQATALVLIESSGEFVDTIHLNEAATAIREIARATPDGELVWRAVLADEKVVDTYRLPGRITLFAENEVMVQIDVERFWANPSLSPDIFVINSP
jgi:outer membrane biogenesis lipoprotein LolB